MSVPNGEALDPGKRLPARGFRVLFKAPVDSRGGHRAGDRILDPRVREQVDQGDRRGLRFLSAGEETCKQGCQARKHASLAFELRAAVPCHLPSPGSVGESSTRRKLSALCLVVARLPWAAGRLAADTSSGDLVERIDHVRWSEGQGLGFTGREIQTPADGHCGGEFSDEGDDQFTASLRSGRRAR